VDVRTAKSDAGAATSRQHQREPDGEQEAESRELLASFVEQDADSWELLGSLISPMVGASRSGNDGAVSGATVPLRMLLRTLLLFLLEGDRTLSERPLPVFLPHNDIRPLFEGLHEKSVE
jgi:hypothetical protein